MNIIQKLQDRFIKAPRGKIRVMSVDEAGVPQKIVAQPNLILYAGADFMAKALGNSGSTLAYLYFEFSNSGTTPPTVTPTRDQGIAYYTALSGTSDYLRVPITMTPVYSATGTSYANNSIMFNAMTAGYTTGSRVTAPLTFTNSVSQVYGVALAYVGTTDVPANDIVFSRSYFASQSITKQANQQVSCYWAIEFF
jgi:hypothetical protein